jgi:hypothetical protein
VNVRRPIAIAAAAGIVALALAGCANQAGVASQVGSTSITDRHVADVVAQVQAQNDKIAGSSFDEKSTTANVVKFLTQAAILDQVAAREGITVNQGDVDKAISDSSAQLGGTRDGVAKYVFSQYGLPSEQLDAFIRANLIYADLVAKIAPGVTDTTKQSAAFQDYMTTFEAEVGVDISPRFGTWKGFTLGPVPDDLSVVPGASASASATPSPSAS